jgi:hypothetical protein
MLEEKKTAEHEPTAPRLPHPAEPKDVQLTKLVELLHTGAISKAEYENHRAKIIDEL